MQKHKLCFHAVVVITQLKFQSGATVFAVGFPGDVLLVGTGMFLFCFRGGRGAFGSARESWPMPAGNGWSAAAARSSDLAARAIGWALFRNLDIKESN